MLMSEGVRFVGSFEPIHFETVAQMHPRAIKHHPLDSAAFP